MNERGIYDERTEPVALARKDENKLLAVNSMTYSRRKEDEDAAKSEYSLVHPQSKSSVNFQQQNPQSGFSDARYNDNKYARKQVFQNIGL